MGILSALTVSSFSSLRGTSLTAAGNQMADVFAMTRQNSITHNDFTAVVIRTQGVGVCSAYCVLELARGDDGTFGSWTQLRPWKYLPPGVVFETGQGSVDTFMSSSQTSATLPLALPTSFPFQGSSIDLSGGGDVVQCYQPDGTLVGGVPLRLRLVQGTADPSSGNVTYSGKLVSGTEVSYYDIYFIANTGATKIGRY